MKFNTVKSKVILFLSILTLLGTIFCIVSCDNFLSENLGKTTINIKLDLSKLIKNSRNDDTQINGYVLKLFVYDAKNYQEGDKEIENLPLLTQTSNKVDINGTVKASLEVAIDSTVIFVGKLFTLNENDVESDKPLYAGKSEVFKVQPKDNKVHLVLSRDKAEIGFEIELQETHEHTFSREWSTSATHHWKVATCEHSSEVSEKAEHSYGEWITTKEATEETAGSKERVCTVCNYKETAEIAQLAHTHTFAIEWTYDGTYHWKVATCGHTEEVSGKAEHTFDGIACTECDYEGFVYVNAGKFQMGSDAGESSEKPVHEVTLTKNFYMGKYEVTQGEYEKYCTYGESSPSSDYGDGDDYPAYYVSWYDALVYCNKRSMDEGLTPCYSINEETDPTKWGTVPTSSDSTWNGVVCNWEANGYRLPTEAEWEYAARAGDNTVDTLTYSGTTSTSSLGDYAWYNENSNSTTHEVGTKKANAFGLYDMSGNVWEWCWNRNTYSYNTNTEGGNDPTGDLSSSYRVRRGGAWNIGSDKCSVSFRHYMFPDSRSNICGFRVVRSATDSVHTHQFSSDWSYDGTYHWKEATCEHTENVTDFGEHSFEDEVCTVCTYTTIPTGFVYVKGITITDTETWTPESEVFVSGRRLTIPDLYVSDHEVTRGEYQEVMGTDPSTADAYDKDGNKLTGDNVLNNPVNYVSWYDALVYCNKLSIKENLTPCYTIDGSTNPDAWGTVPTSNDATWNAVTCNFEADGYRLPTEAEWEWLARGGEEYTYAGSNTVGDVAWYTDNTNNTGTREVKTKAANGYGLYDMNGNVSEKCWDWYGSINESTAADGALSGSTRVCRGGSWYSDSDYCSVSRRYYYNPYIRNNYFGFRLVRPSSK